MRAAGLRALSRPVPLALSRPVPLARPHPLPHDVRAFTRMLSYTRRPLASAVFVGTAQGVGSAVVAAIAHRAMHASSSAPKAAATTIKSSVDTPALRQMNHRLVRSLIGRIKSQPAGPRRADFDTTAMTAWHNCRTLRQGRLAIDLYHAYRIHEGGGGGGFGKALSVRQQAVHVR